MKASYPPICHGNRISAVGVGARLRVHPVASGGAAAEPTTVSVSYPIERNVTDYADFTGRTAAVHSVEVRARVDGYLDSGQLQQKARW